MTITSFFKRFLPICIIGLCSLAATGCSMHRCKGGQTCDSCCKDHGKEHACGDKAKDGSCGSGCCAHGDKDSAKASSCGN